MEVSYKKMDGGWQTWIKATDYSFGPVFDNLKDLWIWQRQNLLGNPSFDKLMTKERIRELAINSDLVDKFGDGPNYSYLINPNVRPYNVETFAVSLIDDCCQIVANAEDKDTLVEQIKQHYSIE